MSSSSILTLINIVASGTAVITGLIGLYFSIKKFPGLVIWFKSKVQLVTMLNLAQSRTADMQIHYDDARNSVTDLRQRVETLVGAQEEFRERIKPLEAIRPVIDSALTWIPLAEEYMQFLELAGRNQHIDLTGKEMPLLPKILTDYFAKNKSL